MYTSITTAAKIAFIEFPAINVERSASFYHNVFGWPIQKWDDGNISFSDSSNELNGIWVKGRTPSPKPGFVIYITVESVVGTLEAVVAYGGTILKEYDGRNGGFMDPAGNVIGLIE